MRPSAARLAFGIASLAAALVAVEASAQQFTLERDFDHLRRADGWPQQNVYWVSLPLNPIIEDLADPSVTFGSPCVGDSAGPPAGDGVIDSDDLICAWWSARENPATCGTFSVGKWDTSTCTLSWRSATYAIGRLRIVGTRFDLESDAGYAVRVSVPSTSSYSPYNHAVLQGDHDPEWTGRPIAWTPTCAGGATTDCCGATAPRKQIVSFPYHGMYAQADEIACGLEGTDWSDADLDGRPDTCWDDANLDGDHDTGEAPTGVFDGRSALSVTTFVNTSEESAPRSRTVTTALGRLRFTGTSFALAAGEAYELQLSPAHQPTLWMPPHS
jgi:hypothetical protein